MAWWIFQNLVTTAVLAAAVALVCRFGRIGPVARHALWVLVLVKFITPPLVVWPWAAPDPLGLAKPANVAARVADGPVALALPDADMSAGDSATITSPRGGLATGASFPPSRSPIQDNHETSGWSWLLGVWIAGSVCLLGIEILRLARLARQVRKGTAPNPAIDQRVRELAHQVGVNPVPVVMLTGITSPVVWCLGRPRLLWPTQLSVDAPLTDACIDGLIVHEIAHVKRRDHIVGWIELVAGLVWWWNPLFWSVRSALREQAELACDAWVISALPNGRRAYAESLLALSSLGAAPSPSMAAVVGVRASSRRVLERRLVMIMKGRAPLRLPSAGLLTLAVMAVATLPAWATGTHEDHQQQTQAAQPVQATQVKSEPKAAQAAKPARAATAVKPSPQAPATTHSIRVREAHAATPATTHEGRVTVARPATAVTHALPTKHVTVGDAVAAQVVHKQERPRAVFSSDYDQLHKFTFFAAPKNLTEEGQKLVADLEAERQAIQKEADAKMEVRREAAIKQLQALQDQYAKAGKLDEAVAIRDFLKAGGPGGNKFSYFIKRTP